MGRGIKGFNRRGTQKAKPFYVLLNGLLQGGNYISAQRIVSGGYGGYALDFGYYQHGATTVGAVVTFNPKGLKTIIKPDGGWGWDSFTVQGDGASIPASPNTPIDTRRYKQVTVTITHYGSQSQWVGCRLAEIYCF